MRGFLKCSGVIQQCCRCYALRDPLTDLGECKSCRALLNISYSETRSLAFCEASSDESPALTFNVGTKPQERAHLCN